MANITTVDDSFATQVQLIDGEGVFNVTDLDNFITTSNMAKTGLDYAVISIIGPQSSGNSFIFLKCLLVKVKVLLCSFNGYVCVVLYLWCYVILWFGFVVWAGKSTLVNNIFCTKFEMMNALTCRLGFWIALIEILLLGLMKFVFFCYLLSTFYLLLFLFLSL